MFRTQSSNPILNSRQFNQAKAVGVNTMTVSGTATKTLVLLALAMITATFTWMMAAGGNMAIVNLGMWGGSLAGLLFVVITVFKPEFAPVTAPGYALCKGFALGAVSLLAETYVLQYADVPGITLQAVTITFGILLTMLVAYQTGFIKATEGFRRFVIIATGGIFAVYMLNMIMSFFGASIPFLHDNGPIGIGISLVIIGIASLNFIIDFDMIEQNATQGAPKYAEWLGALGLMVTLAWVYIEVLHLLMKLYSRRD